MIFIDLADPGSQSRNGERIKYMAELIKIMSNA